MDALIYETNGVAGTGKTTLCGELMNEMSKANLFPVRFIGVSSFRGSQEIGKKLFLIKLKRIFNLFSLNGIKVAYRGFRYIFSNRNIKNDFKEKIIAIMYCVYVYKEYRQSDSETIVVDEGIVQSIVSLVTLMEGVKNDQLHKLIKVFNEITDNVVFINCNIGIDEVISRIKKRNRHDSAIDRLANQELTQFLDLQKDAVETCRRNVHQVESVEVDSELTISAQISNIIEFIKGVD